MVREEVGIDTFYGIPVHHMNRPPVREEVRIVRATSLQSEGRFPCRRIWVRYWNAYRFVRSCARCHETHDDRGVVVGMCIFYTCATDDSRVARDPENGFHIYETLTQMNLYPSREFTAQALPLSCYHCGGQV